MSRMRRPRHPECRAARTAGNSRRARHAPQPVYVRLGHRMLVAFHLLHEDLRVPLRARTRQCHSDGREDGEPAPERLGDDGRRRLAGHRRQPLYPRHPPQRGPQRHPVQQRNLRSDQRPVLAHVETGQDHEDLALRNGREAVQPRRTGDRLERHVLRPFDRHGSRAFEGMYDRRSQAQRHVGDRSPAKL